MLLTSSRVVMLLRLSASFSVLAGCSGAQWQNVQVSPAYQPPKEVQIAVVARATSVHTAEAVQTLQSVLASALAGRGITAKFVPAPTGAPGAHIDVVEWDQGVRALRWLGFGGGQGHIVVMVNSASADGQQGVNGTARGYVRGGFAGGSAYDSASEAGQLIARTIATGKTN
ncbi:MAG: hypothetical protein ABUR63_05420 [Verrucomicrobiota bacterium]